MTITKIKAPAKINLRLKITGCRRDGYHLLEMVMAKIDLFDEIDFEMVGIGTSIEIVGASPTLPFDSTNTLWKAADLVRRESGKKFGIKVKLNKKIPVGAGLGGGSSDAAALLLALNRELNLDWSRERLIKIGTRVGADVPFFLTEGPQKVGGIGEILNPISLPSLPLILIYPGFAISTKEAYGWYDSSGPLPFAGEDRLTMISNVGICGQLENDLEKVVIPRYPVLAELKKRFQDAGAQGTLMSGSGSAVFALFDSQASRDQGYEILLRKKDPSWWLWKGRSLLGGEDSNLD